MNTFILRQYFADGTQANFIIGEGYNLVTRETDKTGRAFNKSLNVFYNVETGQKFPESKMEEACKTYGFITYDEGAKIYPLYEGFKYYMMVGDGKTFANLTLK